MKRFDLRHLKENFADRMIEIMKSNEVSPMEVAIFLFEVGDFSPVQRSADIMKENGYELLNSLKYNEVDWTISVRKTN